MAFQRPFLISLKRQDSQIRWGFGIKGGREYGEPLRIQSVGDDTLAEKYGLHEGDEVIQVGRVNVQDLSLGQTYELLARCGNKIEMFVVREDLLSPRKGKEPPVVKAVVHNPYNSPLSLYSTENIAETLSKQTEVLTEGHLSTEEDEGPENLSFKQKSAVFQLLEEQATQENSPAARTSPQSAPVRKPKVAPPPPPKPKPPPNEHLQNGHDSSYQQVYQDQHRTTTRKEYQTTTSQQVVNQYQYQQEYPSQQQQQSNAYQRSPGYQSPLIENNQSPGYHSPVNNYQPGYQSATTNYQQLNQTNYRQSPTVSHQQQFTQSPPTTVTQQQQNLTYQQSQQQREPQTYQSQVQFNPQSSHQAQSQQRQLQQNYQTSQSNQQPNYQAQSQQNTQHHQRAQQQQSIQHQQNTQHHQSSQHQQKTAQQQSAVSRAELKISPAPPPRGPSYNQDMAAVYKQQYEQHLQRQREQEEMLASTMNGHESKPRSNIRNEDIFEHNSTSGTPITYKAPPAAPPKPNWPPPPQNDFFGNQLQDLSSGVMNVAEVWPPKKSSAVDLPRQGFNPAAVREQGAGRQCVWPPPAGNEMRSGRNTPQSPMTGRRIQWNPSPSPPLTRRTVFSPCHSPARRQDIQWPPPASNGYTNKENHHRPSPRMSRKARFDDYIHEHASINVPQTYRPPPGTQHIEFH